jgi:hypothetical protein
MRRATVRAWAALVVAGAGPVALTLAVAAIAAEPAIAQEPTMANPSLASQVIAEPITAERRDRLIANEVTLETGGGPVVVQWSFSYHGRSATLLNQRHDQLQVHLSLEARLLRGDTPVADWDIARGEAQTRVNDLGPAVVEVTGTASGLHVDRPAAGRHTYRLEVWDDAAGAGGRRQVRVRSRTLLAEERQP